MGRWDSNWGSRMWPEVGHRPTTHQQGTGHGEKSPALALPSQGPFRACCPSWGQPKAGEAPEQVPQLVSSLWPWQRDGQMGTLRLENWATIRGKLLEHGRVCVLYRHANLCECTRACTRVHVHTLSDCRAQHWEPGGHWAHQLERAAFRNDFRRHPRAAYSSTNTHGAPTTYSRPPAELQAQL